jgi:hypothetical protein
MHADVNYESKSQFRLRLLRLSGGKIRMRRYTTLLALLVLIFSGCSASPSRAQMGSVRVVLGKAGLVVGAGAGRGVLTYRGRDYRFRVSGLSLGVTIGATVNKLTGTVSYLDHLKDFAGVYTAVGLGGALAGGAGGVQLRNEKGVMLMLRGPKVGFEFSANLSGIKIAFE